MEIEVANGAWRHGALLSVRVGEQRRQANLEYDTRLRFPQAITEQDSHMEVDVYAKVGTTRVPLAPNREIYDLDIDSEGFSSLALRVKPQTAGTPRSLGMDGLRLRSAPQTGSGSQAMVATPRRKLENAISTDEYIEQHDLQGFATVVVPEKQGIPRPDSGGSSRHSGVSRNSANTETPSTTTEERIRRVRQNAAEYIERYDLRAVLQEMFQRVIRERPENPFEFMQGFLRASPSDGPPSIPDIATTTSQVEADAAEEAKRQEIELRYQRYENQIQYQQMQIDDLLKQLQEEKGAQNSVHDATTSGEKAASQAAAQAEISLHREALAKERANMERERLAVNQQMTRHQESLNKEREAINRDRAANEASEAASLALKREVEFHKETLERERAFMMQERVAHEQERNTLQQTLDAQRAHNEALLQRLKDSESHAHVPSSASSLQERALLQQERVSLVQQLDGQRLHNDVLQRRIKDLEQQVEAAARLPLVPEKTSSQRDGASADLQHQLDTQRFQNDMMQKRIKDLERQAEEAVALATRSASTTAAAAARTGGAAPSMKSPTAQADKMPLSPTAAPGVAPAAAEKKEMDLRYEQQLTKQNELIEMMQKRIQALESGANNRGPEDGPTSANRAFVVSPPGDEAAGFRPQIKGRAVAPPPPSVPEKPEPPSSEKSTPVPDKSSAPQKCASPPAQENVPVPNLEKEPPNRMPPNARSGPQPDTATKMADRPTGATMNTMNTMNPMNTMTASTFAPQFNGQRTGLPPSINGSEVNTHMLSQLLASTYAPPVAPSTYYEQREDLDEAPPPGIATSNPELLVDVVDCQDKTTNGTFAWVGECNRRPLYRLLGAEPRYLYYAEVDPTWAGWWIADKMGAEDYLEWFSRPQEAKLPIYCKKGELGSRVIETKLSREVVSKISLISSQNEKVAIRTKLTEAFGPYFLKMEGTQRGLMSRTSPVVAVAHAMEAQQRAIQLLHSQLAAESQRRTAAEDHAQTMEEAFETLQLRLQAQFPGATSQSPKAHKMASKSRLESSGMLM